MVCLTCARIVGDPEAIHFDGLSATRTSDFGPIPSTHRRRNCPRWALCGKLKRVISQIIPFLAPEHYGPGEGEPDLPDCAGQPSSSRYLTAQASTIAQIVLCSM